MKASVLITTYNQEQVIGQAIESALAQATDFDYEIVVADDGSTDRTQSVIREYHHRFPDRIRPLLRERNLGIMRNFPEAFLECRGQYVACLDGDDYWTSLHKLQRQVEFLDAHPDYSMCFHNALMIWEDGSQAPVLHSPPGRRPTYSVRELFHHDFISTSSVAVVRNHLVREFPGWYYMLPVPDWPFFVLHSMHGPIGYLDENWTVYRQHPAGTYSRLSREKRMEQSIEIVRTFREVLPPEWRPLLSDAIHSRCLNLALYHHHQGRKTRARELAKMSIQEAEADSLRSWFLAAKVSAYMRMPFLAGLVSRCRAAFHADVPEEYLRQEPAAGVPNIQPDDGLWPSQSDNAKGYVKVGAD